SIRLVLDLGGDRLRLAHTERNGNKIPKENWEQQFRYQLVRRTADSLILGIQGRHGILKRIYLRAEMMQTTASLYHATDSLNEPIPNVDSLLKPQTSEANAELGQFAVDSTEILAFEDEAATFDSLTADSLVVHDSAGVFFPADSSLIAPNDSLGKMDSTARLDSIRYDSLPKDQR
ncbi:MAG: hypothetical protein AAF206_30035, partial [Bacteroidota bacterium]